MNQPDAPFSLAVNNKRRQANPVWYMKALLGKNQIGKFMATAAENAGIQLAGRKVTNHSVRKTCISRLLDANIPENYVAQLSGHKKTKSLRPEWQRVKEHSFASWCKSSTNK